MYSDQIFPRPLLGIDSTNKGPIVGPVEREELRARVGELMADDELLVVVPTPYLIRLGHTIDKLPHVAGLLPIVDCFMASGHDPSDEQLVQTTDAPGSLRAYLFTREEIATVRRILAEVRGA